MKTKKYRDDLQAEIDRVKIMLNESEYHHGTAFCAIALKYRNELKLLRKSVSDDVDNGISDYK